MFFFSIAELIAHFASAPPSSPSQQLLEAILSVNTAGAQQQQQQSGSAQLRIQRHLLHTAPGSFSEAVVELAVEMICATQRCPNLRQR